MPTDSTVSIEIDTRIKDEATAIFAEAGLTLSDAFRMLLTRTVAMRSIPFEPLIPNQETIEAMLAARRGELTRVNSMKELMAELNASD